MARTEDVIAAIDALLQDAQSQLPDPNRHMWPDERHQPNRRTGYTADSKHPAYLSMTVTDQMIDDLNRISRQLGIHRCVLIRQWLQDSISQWDRIGERLAR